MPLSEHYKNHAENTKQGGSTSTVQTETTYKKNGNKS